MMTAVCLPARRAATGVVLLIVALTVHAHGATRPSMFVTAEAQPGLRSVADVRRGIRDGHARALWEALLEKVNRESGEPPVSPVSRTARGDTVANRDYTLVARAGCRVMDAAFVALVLGERRYADAALRQIDALYDPAQWPEWGDETHLASLTVSLRHGQIAMPVAVAYDWMHALLTPEERRSIVDGLDRHAIQRYKGGVAAKEHWSERRSNWMTTVVGGFGIVGMALGQDHPDSAWLVDFARSRMETYLSVLGPEGEFNETVQYAGSMAHVVRYFAAVRYATGGRDNPFERHSLAKFYRWYTHMIFPPGRVAGFGDPAPDMPPVVVPAATVAAATKDPLLQWLYLTYCDKMAESHRLRALELLGFDADLKPVSPEGLLPLGRAYHHEARLISSRSSWDPRSTTSVVYAKAGRESVHSHADWGQVCIEGFGEQLVVDLKASYPRSHKERYYEYQQWGHNVFVFGRNDTGGVPLSVRGRQGSIPRADFDPRRGAAWTIDLTGVYDGARTVTRSVVHLLPRIVVVLDDAALAEAQPISLRWHLADAVEPDRSGAFRLRKGPATMAGQITRLDGGAVIRTGRHRHEPPYNRDGLGEVLPPRNEPYLELATEADRCRVLSLFCILGPGEAEAAWRPTPDGWTIRAPEGEVSVSLQRGELIVRAGVAEAWRVSVGDP